MIDFYDSENQLAGTGGVQTKNLVSELKKSFPDSDLILVNSGTGALDVAVRALNLPAGSKVLVPAYTFCSSVSCIVGSSLVPVFCDVDRYSLNMTVEIISDAFASVPDVSAVVVVNYGGWSADLVAIAEFCQEKNIYLIEDAAQSFGSKFDGRSLGTFGDLGCISFHHTKNVHCGEGGLLIINNTELTEIASILVEKGTDKIAFQQGRVQRYDWKRPSSSYCFSELLAKKLMGDVSLSPEYIRKRSLIASIYSEFNWKSRGVEVIFPTIDERCEPNGHIFGLMIEDEVSVSRLRSAGLDLRKHYSNLANSPAVQCFEYLQAGSLNHTNYLEKFWWRLPIRRELEPELLHAVLGKL